MINSDGVAIRIDGRSENPTPPASFTHESPAMNSRMRRNLPPRPTQTATPAQPATVAWPVESDSWDYLFRAWAEALLAQLDGLGGMVSMLVGEYIACAWRLRHVNSYELSSKGLSNRDWMRAHKFAQHAWSKAQIALVRWTRLLLPELRRRAKLGDPTAEARIAALLDLPPLPPPPDLTQVDKGQEDQAEAAAHDASTHTFNSVPTRSPGGGASEPLGEPVNDAWMAEVGLPAGAGMLVGAASGVSVG
jgi:hypothetical protein